MTDMIAVGSIPISPGLQDFDDSKGKVVLWVTEHDKGHSVYLAVEMYGTVDRAYEVSYSDFENVITKMMGEVTMHNAGDPFAELLMGAENAG